MSTNDVTAAKLNGTAGSRERPSRSHLRQRSRRDKNYSEFPRDGAFAASQRHSAWVRWLRFGIIAFSGFFVLLMGGFFLFDPLKRLPKNISAGEVTLDGTKVVVDKPNIAGLQQNGQPFEIKAQSGLEDILKPNVMEMSGVDAKITLIDASKLEVLAKNGVFDSDTNEVFLKGDVRIKNANNYNIRMNQASLNFKTNVLFSDDFTSMEMGSGTISSQTITIGDDGNKITFERDVRSAFQADQDTKDPHQ